MPSYQSVVRATAGLLAYWPLTEPSGSATCADRSGNGHTMTVEDDHGGTYSVNLGAPGPTVPMGTAVAGPFGTRNVVGQKALLTTPNADKGLDMTAAGTLECWINASALDASRHVWYAAGPMGGAGKGASGHLFGDYGNAMGFFIANGAAQKEADADPVGPIVAGTWYYVVATWDGTTMKAYKNAGAAVSSVAQAGVTPIGDATPVCIGAPPDSYQGFRGSIAHVALYSRALSQAEVQAHYDARNGVDASGFPDGLGGVW